MTTMSCSSGPRIFTMPGRSIAIIGAWPASTPNSPSVPGNTTCSTSPENTSCSGETRSKWNMAIRASSHRYFVPHPERTAQWPPRFSRRRPLPGSSRCDGTLRASGGLRGEPPDLLDRRLDGADHVEGRLRQVVVLAVAQALEALDRIGEFDEHAGRSCEHFGDVERLRQEALDLARARHRQLVLFGKLVHAQDGDDVLQRLVALQDLLYAPRHLVVLVADDHRGEHARGRIERVDRRIDALLGDRARQHGGGVEVRKRGRWRRVGEVVGRYVDRLYRGDRALVGGGDALLQGTHVGRQRGLVADRRGNAAEQRRDFRAGLREPEDVVDEEQHVLALVAEIFGNREAGEADTGARPRRLVHLAVHEGAFGPRHGTLFRVLVHLGFDHLVVEIVALARALAHAGEHRIAAVRLGDVVDQFHDDDGLADPGAAEQADLAAFGIGSEQVDDLDAGHEDFRFRRLVRIAGGVLVDGARLLMRHGTGFVDGLAHYVDDAPERALSHRHRDRLAGIGDLLAAHQAFAGVHRHRAHGRLAEVLGDFQHQPVALVLGLQRIEDRRQVTVELHVDDGADDLGDASDYVG